MIDHEDIEARPWLYPTHLYDLVVQVRRLTESLRVAQLTIDQLRQEEKERDEKDWYEHMGEDA